MDKIIKKIVAVILYLGVMYLVYNIFMPELPFFKKSEKFLVKQHRVVKFEEALEPPQEKPDEEKKVDESRAEAAFHQTGDTPFDIVKVRFSCQNCHKDYPHKKNIESRAFYNMHSLRISCLTCHMDNDDKAKVKFAWFDENGNYKKNGSAGNVQIAPYVIVDSYETVIERETADHDDLKKRFKISINKNGSFECKDCHVKKGKVFLDFDSLGYDNERANKLKDLYEVKMYERKEKWRIDPLK